MNNEGIQSINLKNQYFQAYSNYIAAINKPLKGSGNLPDYYLNYVSRELDNARQSLIKLEKEMENWPLAKVDEFVEEEDIESFYNKAQSLKDQIQGISKGKSQYEEIEHKFMEYIDQFIRVYEKADAIMEEEEKKQDQRMALKSMWKDWDTEADKHWESM